MAVFYMRLTVSGAFPGRCHAILTNTTGVFGWIRSQNSNILRFDGDNVHYCRLYAIFGLHSY